MRVALVGPGAVGLVAASPLVARAFTPDATVQHAVLPVLWVVAAIQPIAGVVFVLDGILIGAGDGRYLAAAGVGILAVYVPLAIVLSQGGFTWLWVAYGGFMVARLVTLMARERSERWLVLGSG